MEERERMRTEKEEVKRLREYGNFILVWREVEKNIMLLELLGYNFYTTKREVLLVLSNIIVMVVVWFTFLSLYPIINACAMWKEKGC